MHMRKSEDSRDVAMVYANASVAVTLAGGNEWQMDQQSWYGEVNYYIIPAPRGHFRFNSIGWVNCKSSVCESSKNEAKHTLF